MSDIDKLVDKFALDLKLRLKKIVEKNEKSLLKQYIMSQKNTGPVSKKTTKRASPNKSTVKKRDNTLKKGVNKKAKPNYTSESEYSDSD